MSTLKQLLIFAACISVLGCATTAGTEAHTSVAAFDNAKIVEISEHGAQCASSDPCIGIGGQWSSSHQDYAYMRIRTSSFLSYYGITEATLRIDGVDFHLRSPERMTAMSKLSNMLYESSQSFRVPLDLFRRIERAKDVRIRVNTTKGYVDDVIISGKADSKAYHAIRRFLKAIDTAK